jgi:DNA-binding Lrp family transcriptional regulator
MTRALHWADQQILPEKLGTVLTSLASFHTQKHGCFPSIERIAKRAHCSPATVKRRLKKLQLLVLFQKSTTFRQGRRLTVYTLAFSRVVDAPTSEKTFRAWLPGQVLAASEYKRRLDAAGDKAERVKVILSRSKLLVTS